MHKYLGTYMYVFLKFIDCTRELYEMKNKMWFIRMKFINLLQIFSYLLMFGFEIFFLTKIKNENCKVP